MNTIIVFFLGIGAAAGVFIILKLSLKSLRFGGSARSTSFHSSIENLKSIGELSVFKAFTKEIVTEVDHSWGEVGKKYLSWFLSGKKMAMIFEFEIDFRYDLRSPDFKIQGGPESYTFRMPSCFHELNIRDIHFYDEQKSRVLPFLIGDFAGNLIGDGFTEEDKNRLKNEAKNRAQEKAKEMIEKLASDVEKSARRTLESLAKALGAEKIRFDFKHTGMDDIRKIEIPKN